MQSKISRRTFTKAAAASLAIPAFVPSTSLGLGKRPAPSDRIVMATVGTGGRGTGDMNSFMRFPEVQMVAVCDPVPPHRERAKGIVDRKYSNTDCQSTSDFREVVSRDDVDAVLIGTPDHWHAIITIECCKNGKDVFCEKPESLTIAEGRAMVTAARKYSRVVSGGSQRVLGDYGDIPRLVRGGAIGKVQEIFVSCGGPSGECYLKPEKEIRGMDWSMWLGPAPFRPFNQKLVRGGFRPFRDYSGGGMTDWGAHRFGAAMFAAGIHKMGPKSITPPNGKDVKHLTFEFENGLKMYHGGTNNITYKGTEGTVPGKHPQFMERVDMEGYRGRGGIFGDFIDCVKTRELPFRDIEIAHRACTVCHLGNIAYWLNRPLKWDPEKEQIIDDEAANRWLDRPRRGDWKLEV